MQGSLAGLLHEAASVYRLVEFIQRFCREQESSRSYVPATRLFFTQVISLAESTKRHLVKTAAEANKRSEGKGSRWDESWLTNERASLHTIKGAWNVIHRYLKPAADAHALQVPVPLVKLAECQLESVEGMQGASIAVLLTPELNYFQTSHTRLKKTIDTLRDAANAPPETPRKGPIGFVELPFSQGPSLFTNIALYHELGHFMLEERSASGPLSESAARSLEEVYREEFAALSPDKKAGAEGWLRKWAEEIFCDLFAIRLVGPAFSFASIEMFSLIGLLAGDYKIKFRPSHPAPACRFQQHLKLLREDGWWDVIDTLQSDHKTQIDQLSAIPESDYRIYLDKTEAPDQRALQAFGKMLPAVHELAKRLTAQPTDARECFAAERENIEQCLSKGIVPSRLFAGRPVSPAFPIAVMNAAFCFYLTELTGLIGSLAEQDPGNLEHRSHWTKRLEMWTVKAIEDYFLLDGVQKHGSGSTRGAASAAHKGPWG
jgi:hypothetical protein